MSYDFYDITEECFKKLSLRYQEYIDLYPTFISEYNLKCDGDERSYIKYELEIFQESLKYMDHLDLDKYPNTFIRYEFESEFKSYLPLFRSICISKLSIIQESTEKKCEYLEERLWELSDHKLSNTLKQRILLIKYLDRIRTIKLEKISQDQTAQA